MLASELPYDDELLTTAGSCNRKLVAALDCAMRLGPLSVYVYFSATARTLSLGPSLEQTGDIKPYVQTNTLSWWGLVFDH